MTRRIVNVEIPVATPTTPPPEWPPTVFNLIRRCLALAVLGLVAVPARLLALLFSAIKRGAIRLADKLEPRPPANPVNPVNPVKESSTTAQEDPHP